MMRWMARMRLISMTRMSTDSCTSQMLKKMWSTMEGKPDLSKSETFGCKWTFFWWNNHFLSFCRKRINTFIEENKALVRRMFGDYHSETDWLHPDDREHFSSFHDGPDAGKRRPKRSLGPTPLSNNKWVLHKTQINHSIIDNSDWSVPQWANRLWTKD